MTKVKDVRERAADASGKSPIESMGELVVRRDFKVSICVTRPDGVG